MTNFEFKFDKSILIIYTNLFLTSESLHCYLAACGIVCVVTKFPAKIN